MAVTTTPLGFKKPDGADPIRNGDNVIADNAQKAEDLHAAAQSRIGALEVAISPLVEDPADPGFYIIGGVA